jgi:hypothetical protein
LISVPYTSKDISFGAGRIAFTLIEDDGVSRSFCAEGGR